MALRETLETIRSVPDPKDEENAKFQIIAPILGDLGWDSTKREILYEYQVGGKEGGWVDIALMGPDHPVALIEAKRPGANLTQHVDQVLSYAFCDEVDFCVITTGLEWWFYLPREGKPPTENQFAVLKIREDPVEKLTHDLEIYLSKKSLLSGQVIKQAQQVLLARNRADKIHTELPKLWESMLTKPDNDLVELFRQRMRKKTNLLPDYKQVKEFLQSLAIPHTSHTLLRPSSEHYKGLSSSQTTRPQKPPPSGFLLWGEHKKVSYKKGLNPGTDLLRKVAEILYQHHGQKLLECLLNKTSTSKVPVPYASPNSTIYHKELSDTGIYLWVNLNNAQACDRAKTILKLMGHKRSDLEILYD